TSWPRDWSSDVCSSDQDAATGTLQWQTSVENRIYDNAYYMSSLAVADNSVYVPAPSSLWALDAGTGTIRWKSPGPIQDAAHVNKDRKSVVQGKGGAHGA